MSNVKLQASASGTGTVTIAPPVTNSDLTINLPANSGTVPTIASVVNNGVVYTNSTGAITSSSALTFDGTNLGVGTSSPTLRLEVSNGTNTGYMHPGIGIGLSVGTKNNSVLTLDTNNTERARLDTSGNLGLGVTPSATSGGYKNVQNGNAVVMGSTSDVSAYWNSNATFNSGWKYISNGTSARYEQTALGGHAFFTAASGTAGNTISFTQAMTLDASGRLLVGVTSGSYALDVGDVSGGNMFRFTRSGAELSGFISGGVPFIGSTTNNAVALMTNNTERARITSGGDLLVGTTSAVNSAKVTVGFSGAANNGFSLNDSGATANTVGYVYFSRAGTSKGSITYNDTTNLIAYNTTSDYRLKTLIAPVTGSGARLDALNPIEYEWKANGKRARGFFAHEFQQVYADSVTGEKDAVDEEGKPVYQAMQASTSEVIADLVAEIQSLRARVAALESNP